MRGVNRVEVALVEGDRYNDASYGAALWATYLFGFDAFGFTDPMYSASGDSTNLLCPLPDLPTDIGTRYTDPVTGPITIDGA